MATTINDFLLKLGFDGSAVEKGIKDLQTKAERLAKTINDKGQKALIQEVKAQQEAVKLQKEKTRLAEQESRTRQQIARETRRTSQQLKLPRSGMVDPLDVQSRQARFRGIKEDLAKFEGQLADKDLSGKQIAKFQQLRQELRANISSVEKLSKQTQMSDIAYKKFAKTIQTTSRQLSEFKKVTHEARQQVTFMDRALGRAKGSMIQFAAGFGSAFVAMEGMTAVKEKTLELSQLKMALEVVERDLGGDFNDSLAKVTQTSDELGIPLTTALEGFKNLRAAMGDKMAVQDVHDLNQSILGASRAMGLTADRTKLVVRAFSQMASKGKIQAEELRQQLGEHLPNAVNIFARALGISTEELSKQMELGNLYAADVLPKVTKELKKFADESNELTKGSLPRMQAQFTAAIEKMQEWMNLEKPLARFYGAMTGFIKENEDTWKGLGAVIGAVLDGISQALEIVTPIMKVFGIAFNEVFGNVAAKEVIKWGVAILTLIPIFRILKWGGKIIKGLVDAFRGVSKFPLLNKGMEVMKKNVKALTTVFTALVVTIKQAWDWLTKLFGFQEDVAEKREKLLASGEQAGFTSLRQIEDMRNRLNTTGNDIITNSSRTTKTNSDNQVEQTINITTTADPNAVGSAVGVATDQALRGEML